MISHHEFLLQKETQCPLFSVKCRRHRVEIDGSKTDKSFLDRPPLNVISMVERDQLRRVFENLDADGRIRIIVLRAAGPHFSSGGQISGFLEASAEAVSTLAWNVAAPARCRKPVVAANRGYCFGVGFELSPRAIFARLGDMPYFSSRAEAWPDSGIWRLGAPAEDHRSHARERHHHALQAHLRIESGRMGYRNRMREG
jgi:hypothetical protein